MYTIINPLPDNIICTGVEITGQLRQNRTNSNFSRLKNLQDFLFSGKQNLYFLAILKAVKERSMKHEKQRRIKTLMIE